MQVMKVPSEIAYTNMLKDMLPANKTEEQQLRMLGDLLKNMSKECLIKAEERTWYTMHQP